MCGLQYVLKRAQAKGSKPKIHRYSRSVLPPHPKQCAPALVALQCVCIAALGNEDQSGLKASEWGQ